MSDSHPRIAAVIGHSDDAELLEKCIRHHLRIGVDNIFVSLNKDSIAADALSGHPKVRAGDPGVFARQDPFLYLSAAMEQVVAWASPDWVLFADTDEFWLPRSGQIAETRGLADRDLILTQRYTMPPLREADGTIGEPDFEDPFRLPIIIAREPIDDAYLAGDFRTPFVMGVDAPKLLVRPQLVQRVGTGGHNVLARDPQLRWHMPDDLLILHAPFTTEARFRRKIASIRATFGAHGNRFNPRQAWHWRYWLSLSDDELSVEFQRQSFRASAVPALRRERVLALPADQYDRLRAEADGLKGDALHETLSRAIDNYSRTASAREPAPPLAEPAARPFVSARLMPAPERRIDDALDCYFYHCMDIPGHGEVLGQWDLRGRESTYLGGVELSGRTVLEIGTASGHLAFWMERQGADVTSFDLDENQQWDMVPFAGVDHELLVKTRKAVVRQINNSWWFVRNRMQARAKVIYGTVYELDRLDQTFDVVTVNSVLLHLRDPFLALARAASRTHDRIIVTDIAQTHFLPQGSAFDDSPVMHFLPRFVNQGPMDTWWFVTERLVEEFLRILGFTTVTITHHTQRFMPDEDWHFYTAVGQR
jgi:2-polyprenyl-3-methyl-5-hydroxy-6-metoxy-1,4-benzoquinol methylase